VGTPVAIIGAGYAGLACGVELARRGIPCTVFERSHTLGGRARVVHKDHWTVDNGQHILLGAYTELTRLLRLVGVTPRTLLTLPLTLQVPGKLHLQAAGLPAPWHLAMGLLRARGLSWADRKAALGFLSWLKKRRFQLERDVPVSNLLLQASQTHVLRERVWEPLCVAALNTPSHEASAQIFANVLRDSLGADARASDLLLPRVDMSELFPVPATRYLGQRRGLVHTATGIDAIEATEAGFRLKGDWSLDLYQQVVVATAPYHAATLLATTGQCERLVELIHGLDFEPIVTLYLAYPEDIRLPGPMIGLPDGPGQWAFDRRAMGHRNEDCEGHHLIAVVISAHGPHDELDQDALLVAAHVQLERLLQRRLPTPAWSQAITEKRATFACRPGVVRPSHHTPLPGLWLAGDYVDSPYPATLESAVRSGVRCAEAVANRLRKAAGPIEP
jgi:squalene-associated FAD-dependent desaturase